MSQPVYLRIVVAGQCLKFLPDLSLQVTQLLQTDLRQLALAIPQQWVRAVLKTGFADRYYQWLLTVR